MKHTLSLSLADAQKMIAAVLQEANERALSVAVVDPHGELLAFARTDACALPPITIAINKAYTAARERRTSRDLGNASKSESFPLTNFGELRYVGWGGGVPVIIDGQVVGAIGVSGLPEEVDMQLALIGIEALKG